MRQVRFTPPDSVLEMQLPWWEEWVGKARDEQDKLNAAYPTGEVDFKTEVWGALKKWLADNVFGGKCAYCEASYAPTSPGEAEHYRPKGRVTFKSGTGTRTRAKIDGDQPHPGYYWLAYEWQNLIPACSKCNNAKSDQFPIADDKKHRADASLSWEALNELESPLLINPYVEDPNQFLIFDDLGFVHARNSCLKGQSTIDVLDLNRQILVDARLHMLKLSTTLIDKAVSDYLSTGAPIAVSLDIFLNEKAWFSQAVRSFVNLKLNMARNRLDGIKV